jgi:hypothetical protein
MRYCQSKLKGLLIVAKIIELKAMKAYKKGPTIKNIMLQQRGQMRVTRNAFSESAYQLIFKYVFDLLLMDCCMKLVLLSVIMCAMQKR